MQIELRRLLRELGTTSIFVTHDQDEALTMSDRVAVMNRGAIEQLDTPEAIYRRPATPFALEFVGLSTRLAGTSLGTEQGMVEVETAFGRLRAPGNFVKARPCCWRCGPSASRSSGPRTTRSRPPARRGVPGLQGPALFRGARRRPAHGRDVPTCRRLPAPGSEMTLGWAVADTLLYPAP